MRCKYAGIVTTKQCAGCYNKGITKDKTFYKNELSYVKTRAHCVKIMERKTMDFDEVVKRGLLRED